VENSERILAVLLVEGVWMRSLFQVSLIWYFLPLKEILLLNLSSSSKFDEIRFVRLLPFKKKFTLPT